MEEQEAMILNAAGLEEERPEEDDPEDPLLQQGVDVRRQLIALFRPVP
ncbi:MAG: hypothetical protein GY858_09695 [Candidatus Omnitrophica bacterium]|nr:hypothetical protein [Candidatus Omnitrophota bacterium]